jgi:hypothetical protein
MAHPEWPRPIEADKNNKCHISTEVIAHTMLDATQPHVLMSFDVSPHEEHACNRTGKPEDAQHSEKTTQMHPHVQRGPQHICGTSAYIAGRLQIKKIYHVIV